MRSWWLALLFTCRDFFLWVLRRCCIRCSPWRLPDATNDRKMEEEETKKQFSKVDGRKTEEAGTEKQSHKTSDGKREEKLTEKQFNKDAGGKMVEKETKKQSQETSDGAPSVTDHDRANDQSPDVLSRLTLWLYRPSDPSSLGLFRLLFGLLMIHDLMNERWDLSSKSKWSNWPSKLQWHGHRIQHRRLQRSLLPSRSSFHYLCPPILSQTHASLPARLGRASSLSLSSLRFHRASPSLVDVHSLSSHAHRWVGIVWCQHWICGLRSLRSCSWSELIHFRYNLHRVGNRFWIHRVALRDSLLVSVVCRDFHVEGSRVTDSTS